MKEKGAKAVQLEQALLGAFCMENLGDGALTPDQFLRKYHVQSGVDGLDFSDTKSSFRKRDDKRVDLKCNYTIEVPFSWWVEIPINFSAEAHTRAWEQKSKVAESRQKRKTKKSQEKSVWDDWSVTRTGNRRTTG